MTTSEDRKRMGEKVTDLVRFRTYNFPRVRDPERCVVEDGHGGLSEVWFYADPIARGIVPCDSEGKGSHLMVFNWDVMRPSFERVRAWAELVDHPGATP